MEFSKSELVCALDECHQLLDYIVDMREARKPYQPLALERGLIRSTVSEMDVYFMPMKRTWASDNWHMTWQHVLKPEEKLVEIF